MGVSEELSLRQLLEQAAEAGARKALEAAPWTPQRLVPIRECRIGYRRALAAIKAGELRAYRVGQNTWIQAADEDVFILKHQILRERARPTEADDEVSELIALNERRRRSRPSRGRK